MTDPPAVRNRTVLVRKTEEQLRGERDELLTQLDGCIDPDCDRHAWVADRLDTVRWLLGEAPA
jgi:hypothetical protein